MVYGQQQALGDMDRVHTELPAQRLHNKAGGRGPPDYMVDMETVLRLLGLSQKETLTRIKENSTPALRMYEEVIKSHH